MAVSLTLTRTEHVQWARLPDAAIGRAAYVILKMLHHVSPTTALLPSPPPRLLPALRHHCLRGSSPRGPSSGARSATAFSATTAAAGPQVRKGKVSWRWAPQHRSPSLTGEGAPRLPPHSCRSLCVCASSFHSTLPPPLPRPLGSHALAPATATHRDLLHPAPSLLLTWPLKLQPIKASSQVLDASSFLVRPPSESLSQWTRTLPLAPSTAESRFTRGRQPESCRRSLQSRTVQVPHATGTPV